MDRYRKYGSASQNQDTGSISKEPLNVSLVYQKSIFCVEDTQIMVLRTRYRAKNCRRSWTLVQPNLCIDTAIPWETDMRGCLPLPLISFFH